VWAIGCQRARVHRYRFAGASAAFGIIQLGAAGRVNEVVMFVGSVIAGCGLPSLAPQPFGLPLHLLDVKRGGRRDRGVALPGAAQGVGPKERLFPLTAFGTGAPGRARARDSAGRLMRAIMNL